MKCVVFFYVAIYACFFSGRVSLSSSSKGTACLLQDILKFFTHTMSCYHSCVSAKMSNPHAEILGPLFTLLANTSLSQECRAIFKKVHVQCMYSTCTIHAVHDCTMFESALNRCCDLLRIFPHPCRLTLFRGFPKYFPRMRSQWPPTRNGSVACG